MARLLKTVVMVGMMGAGKTAVGKVLAERLGVPFKDSDAAIVEASKMSIAEIFERDGEAFFRAREAEVLERLLRAAPCILSTGGGVFMAENNRKLVHNLGTSVWLDVPLPVLWSRVKGKDTRPLLRTADPEATLRELYDARLPLYAKAELHVKGDGRVSVADMAGRVQVALTQAGYLQEEIQDV